MKELNHDAKWVWKSVESVDDGYSVECIKVLDGEVFSECRVDNVKADNRDEAVEMVLERLKKSLI